MHKKFPDIHVEILDLVAEGDRMVVRNQWTGTKAASGTKFEFSGIVIENRSPAIGGALGISYAAKSGEGLAALSQLQTFLGFFALIFIVKACVFIGGLPENGRVETKCLPFDNGLLAVCR